MKGCALGCATTGLFLATCVLLGFASRALWLPAIGHALEVPADVRPADVIVVLGGGNGDRARYAGELFARGLAQHVIATGGPLGTETGADDLVTHGVPRRVIVLANGTQNTRGDALRSRQIMEGEGWHTALLVTDPYHIRRSLLTFQGAFRGGPLTVWPAPVVGSWFDADHWWQSEEGFVAVDEEYLKLAYYLVRGYVSPPLLMAR
jgi:uncharacterized SAM-binding protein YcdF (DUF218 family)